MSDYEKWKEMGDWLGTVDEYAQCSASKEKPSEGTDTSETQYKQAWKERGDWLGDTLGNS